MREIPLYASSLVAIVDDEDYAKLSSYSWLVKIAQDKRYAITMLSGGKMIYMHQLIQPLGDGKKMTVDHISRDTLDNRKCNLRYATMSQQMANSAKQDRFLKSCSSEHKGVSWDKESKSWKSSIRVNRKLMNLGRYRDEAEAAEAYNRAAVKYFGEFARLNVVKKTPQPVNTTDPCQGTENVKRGQDENKAN